MVVWLKQPQYNVASPVSPLFLVVVNRSSFQNCPHTHIRMPLLMEPLPLAIVYRDKYTMYKTLSTVYKHCWSELVADLFYSFLSVRQKRPILDRFCTLPNLRPRFVTNSGYSSPLSSVAPTITNDRPTYVTKLATDPDHMRLHMQPPFLDLSCSPSTSTHPIVLRRLRTFRQLDNRFPNFG